MKNFREFQKLTLWKFLFVSLFSVCIINFLTVSSAYSAKEQGEPPNLEGFDLEVLKKAEKCAADVISAFKELVKQGRLNINQLFDTFYIPIPDTDPQKFHTQYDTITDEVLTSILDSFLEKDDRLLYVVATDKNGYVPSHNSKYRKPLTTNREYNAKNNRTKRLFNDRTGSKASKNKKEYLLQSYRRDTGEMVFDMSVPLLVDGKHWGAIRIGYIK